MTVSSVKGRVFSLCEDVHDDNNDDLSSRASCCRALPLRAKVGSLAIVAGVFLILAGVVLGIEGGNIWDLGGFLALCNGPMFLGVGLGTFVDFETTGVLVLAATAVVLVLVAVARTGGVAATDATAAWGMLLVAAVLDAACETFIDADLDALAVVLLNVTAFAAVIEIGVAAGMASVFVSVAADFAIGLEFRGLLVAAVLTDDGKPSTSRREFL